MPEACWAKWTEIYQQSQECLNLSSPCLVCGAVKLHRWYQIGKPVERVIEEYNQSYKDGILEVIIDQATYDSAFKALERRYDVKDGRVRTELPVPQRLFPTLNKFPRVLKPS